ncbi:hypothetical protein [Chitinophaga polysaccharea]|uniref:hypothetical protein n=1 Tax=Chitinophaga polysaccharea TaxID=1293035 RepID=UPI001157AEEF|nr:hypothetical protein [Chitinophaga polysaccharea]
MKLIELIDHLKTASKAQQLISAQIPDVDFDQVEVYMKDHCGLNAEIAFFDADKIPGNLIIEVEGIKYENLFPLYMVQEMVEDYVQEFGNSVSDQEIAQKILDYREHDA